MSENETPYSLAPTSKAPFARVLKLAFVESLLFGECLSVSYLSYGVCCCLSSLWHFQHVLDVLSVMPILASLCGFWLLRNGLEGQSKSAKSYAVIPALIASTITDCLPLPLSKLAFGPEFVDAAGYCWCIRFYFCFCSLVFVYIVSYTALSTLVRVFIGNAIAFAGAHSFTTASQVGSGIRLLILAIFVLGFSYFLTPTYLSEYYRDPRMQVAMLSVLTWNALGLWLWLHLQAIKNRILVYLLHCLLLISVLYVIFPVLKAMN